MADDKKQATKMMCPRWGHCKAEKKCPIPDETNLGDGVTATPIIPEGAHCPRFPEKATRKQPRQKVYAISQYDGTFEVIATFRHSAGESKKGEAESWLDQYGSDLACEKGSVHEDRASSSGCAWKFKTAKEANLFGRHLNFSAPPCVVVMLGDTPDEQGAQ